MNLYEEFFYGIHGGLGLLSGAEIVSKIIVHLIFVPTVFLHSDNIEEGLDEVIAFVFFRPPADVFQTPFFGVPAEVRCSKLLEEALRLVFGCYAESTIAPAGTSTTHLYLSVDIYADIEFMIPLFVVSCVDEGAFLALIALDNENIAVLKPYQLGLEYDAAVLDADGTSVGDGDAVTLGKFDFHLY